VIEGNVYTSTETPSHFEIALHSESTFAQTWPRWVCFHCVTPARSKGRTPIADVQKVYLRLPSRLRERFEETGVLYLRNFSEGPGMNWQTAFQVSSKDELEAKCRQEDISWEWRGETQLRTYQRRPSVVWHPVTGIPAWFNQALALHVTALPQPLRDVLVRQLGDLDLPHQTFYGNGEPFEPETIETIRQAYAEEVVRFSWEVGDLLILDNLVFAHGRESFEGLREILACLAGPTSWTNLHHSRVAKG
jgi:alpha-ketoglutarate-dependent taurine dioxygenase